MASFLGILLLAAASFGQNPLPSGNLYGTAVDEQGKSLSEVTATLTGPGASQSATTLANGDFHFLNLSPGVYSVTLEHAGFETVRRDVTVSLGKNAVFAVTMPVAGATAAVTVSGQTPVVDSRKTETGATFGQKELQTIPTTRDPAAILRQVPGVLLFNVNVSGEDSLFQPGVVGKGSHSDQNTYNVDGVGITEAYGGIPVYFDFDSLETVGVVTGGTDPSLTTPGVTLNLVTKRGTNQFLGSARVLYTEVRRVGLRHRGRRSALERPPVALGRVCAGLVAGPDDSQRRRRGVRGVQADRRALEREVERPGRCSQLARPLLPGLLQDKPGK